MIDIVGQRFTRLVVLAFADLDKYRHSRWRCQCDCGRTVIVTADNLRRGGTRSCGCVRRERLLAIDNATHGDWRGGRATKEYKAWELMLYRCRNPRCHAYKNYGGRGIRVCGRWLDYGAFLADVGRAPGKEYSLDRVNNDGHYEPGNVRWATWNEQARNRRPLASNRRRQLTS